MAAIRKGRVSLQTFSVGACITLLPCIGVLGRNFQNIWDDFWILLLLAYIVCYNGVLFVMYNVQWNQKDFYKVAVRAAFLGTVFGLGILISVSGTTWKYFGWYIVALSFFHFSEYYTTAVTNPRSLTLDSFLLDHSREYKLAAMASWLEFTIEWYIAPGLKQFHMISYVGLLIVLLGEIIRKASMFTAKTNFNHYVQYIKQDGHTLVTSGIYSYCRHPSYVGWFYWSIGTQLILFNPVCLVGYTIVSWKFFKERIYEEEIYLLNFFGEHYLDYQKKVGTGLPFISGYRGEM
ncbi:protein-S-isoprenylcysteine O-methyltransferase-like [Pecten maximus]|uniref:protein-S-isoprenylcysteine O-methyltransferase-like n=1 Tax=Pecten maximus TaxID=6579 RepID=UPI001458AF64|nr:protein-S-isoprenylcysteine O-methyltransferase-like [Pecten maximus]